MSRKIKIMIAVAAGVTVLALGAGAIVMAADTTTPTTTTATAAKSNTLFANVAATLGVTEQQLTDAFNTANAQAQSQKIDQALAQAVTKGTITQAEADAIKAWLTQKPAAADALKAWQDAQPKVGNENALRGILGFGGMMLGPGKGADTNNTDLMTAVVAALNTATGKSITVAQLQSAFTAAQAQLQSDAITKYLADAVANGKITQSEADQIQSWWNSKPAALNKLTPNGGFCFPGIGGMGRGGMMPGFNGRGNGKDNPQGKPPTTTPVTPKGT